MATGIIYDDRYLQHKTGHHVESPERLIATMNLIKEMNLLESSDFTLLEPKMATVDEIKWVHEEDMIEKARLTSLKAKGGKLQCLDLGDTVLSEESFDVSLLAAGGAITAIDAILEGKVDSAFALVRPPGHHANQFRSSGFCVFNNMAIMAEYALLQENINRVAIFDIDLHHGNGTSDIFYDRDDVLFFSSHQDGRSQYPGSGFPDEIGEGKGEGYTVNVPLAPGARDDVVQKIFSQIIKPVFLQYDPDFILGSIGCDAHHGDPLSGLAFSFQGYGNYVKGFKEIADKCCNGRVALTLEGGYRVDNVAKIVVNILHALAGKELPFVEDATASGENLKVYHRKLMKTLKKNLGKFWTF